MQPKGDRALPWASAESFAAWVDPHRAAMLGFATRLTSTNEAEDIVQEALALAWRHRDRYDPVRGSPRTWLLTLTADRIGQHRRRWRRRPQPMAQLPDLSVGDVLPDVDLQTAITTLSRRQQLAITAYYFLDLPVADVATVMGCSPGTVKSTLASARSRLREQLKETKP